MAEEQWKKNISLEFLNQDLELFYKILDELENPPKDREVNPENDVTPTNEPMEFTSSKDPKIVFNHQPNQQTIPIKPEPKAKPQIKPKPNIKLLQK